MNFKNIILLILINFSLKCYADEPNKMENEIIFNKSSNGKYSVKSYPVIYWQKGNTNVYCSDKLVYVVNEYKQKSIISDDGQFLILYSDNFDTPNTEYEILNTNLFSIYKDGKLIKKFRLMDLFAFSCDVMEDKMSLIWLKKELSQAKINQSILIQPESKTLKLITIDGFEWLVALDTGKVLKKNYIGPHWREVNFDKKNIIKNEIEKISVFKDFILSNRKYEFNYFNYSKGEDYEAKYIYSSFLQYFYGGQLVSIYITIQDFEKFKINFPIIIKSINSFLEKNKTNNLNYRVDCYLFDSNTSHVTGIPSFKICESPESLEFLNNTFMVREYKELEFLGLPFLIKYAENGESFDFEIIKIYKNK